MGSWSDLPIELAIIIIRSLHNEHLSAPNRDMISCSYVSHQFRDITEPIIYRNVYLELDPERSDFRQLRRFVRTIVSRPQLGNFVRLLKVPRLPYYRNRSYDPEDMAFTLAPYDVEYIVGTELNGIREDLTILMDAASRLGLPNHLIIYGGSIGELFLLLHHLPLLENLMITMRNEIRFIATSALGDFVGGIPMALQSVSKLSITCEDFEVSLHFFQKSR